MRASIVTTIQNALQVPGSAKRQDFKIKVIKIRNEEIKLRLFIYDFSAYVKKFRDSPNCQN